MGILMKNYIDLGFTKVYYYSLLILSGMIIGIFLVYRELKRHNYDVKALENMAFYTILCGLVGARFWYVLFNLSEYKDNFLEVFAVWHGGLAIHGGIFGGLLFLFFYCRKQKFHFLKIVDIAMPALLIGQIIGRWGNFFNQEAHGGPVSRAFLDKLCIPDFIIDGMFIKGKYYHPTFLYESIFNLLLLVFILIIRRNKKIKEGMVFSIYLMGYGILRFFIESLRTDSLMLGSIRVAQLISVIFFIIGLVLMIISIRKFDYYNKEEKENKKESEPKKELEEKIVIKQEENKKTNNEEIKKTTNKNNKKNNNAVKKNNTKGKKTTNKNYKKKVK